MYLVVAHLSSALYSAPPFWLVCRNVQLLFHIILLSSNEVVMSQIKFGLETVGGNKSYGHWPHFESFCLHWQQHHLCKSSWLYNDPTFKEEKSGVEKGYQNSNCLGQRTITIRKKVTLVGTLPRNLLFVPIEINSLQHYHIQSQCQTKTEILLRPTGLGIQKHT